MKMHMTNAEYAAYIKGMQRPSPLGKNLLKAFVVGGLICCVGQALSLVFERLLGLDKEAASTAVSLSLVFLAALFTGLGWYDDMGRFAGAGTLVPITGFANSVVAPALEFKTEGFVLGTAVKMFSIAGPVIVFGSVASVIYGLLLCLFGLGG